MQTSFKNASVNENASESRDGLSNKLSGSKQLMNLSRTQKLKPESKLVPLSTENVYQVNDSRSAWNYDMWN
jgi:hypothetical protein